MTNWLSLVVAATQIDPPSAARQFTDGDQARTPSTWSEMRNSLRQRHRISAVVAAQTEIRAAGVEFVACIAVRRKSCMFMSHSSHGKSSCDELIRRNCDVDECDITRDRWTKIFHQMRVARVIRMIASSACTSGNYSSVPTLR
jgi:hypothetical protein